MCWLTAQGWGPWWGVLDTLSEPIARAGAQAYTASYLGVGARELQAQGLPGPRLNSNLCQDRKDKRGLEYESVAQCLPSIPQILDSILGLTKLDNDSLCLF